MKISIRKRKNLLYNIFVFAFLAFAGVLSAQEKQQQDIYVPQVGQKGKDVVWVPSPPEMISAMFRMAGVNDKDTLIDLGSGDGRLVIAAAKLGARAIGIEYNDDLVHLSRKNAMKEKVEKKTLFIKEDFFISDLSGATVITLFLLPEINIKLRPKLLALRPGTRIVSNSFAMGDWKPDMESITDENPNGWNTAYLWIIPARVRGTWKIGNEMMKLKQTYQTFRGTIYSDEKGVPVSEGKITGSTLSFRIGDFLYSGIIKGNKMSGTRSSGKASEPWEAAMVVRP
jgi:hypothetical protein